MSKEQVLCLEANRLPPSWMAEKVVLPLPMEEFISQCADSGFSFVDRNQAETDPSYKQVIPYLVVQTQDKTRTAAYLRKGSEKRLHDLWSIGIGGHINPQDAENQETHKQKIGSGKEDFQQILVSGMGRELDEELTRRPCQDRLQFAGIISENATEVGRVHLGAVFSLLTTKPEDYLPGPELRDFQWVDSRNLSSLNLELWSVMSLELFAAGQPFQQFQDNGVFLL